VNGQNGSTLTEVIQMPIDSTYLSPERGPSGIMAEAWVENTDPETEETTYSQIRGDFIFNTYFYKALHVALQNSFGDYRRRVYSYKMTPYFFTDSEGREEIRFTSEPWGDVGVQVVAEAPLFVTPTSWERTDEAGRRSFLFAAQPEPDEFNEYGLWHAPVKIRATKDGYQLETGGTASLPFAVVKNAQKVWHLTPSGSIGDIADPVVPPANLKPGDRLQVGSETSPGAFMDVEFINGQHIRSEAGAYGGFVATIKNDGIAEGTALLWMDVKNTVQEIRDDPRRAARMLIYKAPGNALDTALGVPDAVGWVSETPGGLVSKHLAKWGEQAYQPSPPPEPQGKQASFQPSNETTAPAESGFAAHADTEVDFFTDGSVLMENRGKQASFQLLNETTAPAESGFAAHADTKMDFFNDGSVLMENRGDPMLLLDEGGQTTVIPSGASCLLTEGDGGAVYATAALTATEVWEAPLPGEWVVSPTNATTITTPRPLITIANEEPKAFNWSTAVVTLDNGDITPLLEPQLDSNFTVLALSGTLPESLRLADGDHTLSLTVNTHQGEQVVYSSVFTVAAGGNMNSYAEARAFANGVWVSWEYDENFAEFDVQRAADTEGVYTSLTEGSPRRQPGFFDSEPLETNNYRIVALDDSGLPAATTTVATAWSPAAPAAPDPPAVTNLYAEPMNDTIEIRFDDSFAAVTRWVLERSIGEDDFERIVPQEETIRSGFLDNSAPPGSNLVYRLAAVSADGVVTGSWQTVSANLPNAPTPPGGFAVVNAANGVALRWDDYADRRATELRVYRNSGAGFERIATLPTQETEYTDTSLGHDSVRYFLTAAGPEHESAATTTLGLATHPPASEAAEIRMADSTMTVNEGDGVVSIPVVRSGNLTEPAITHFATAYSTAEENEDYVKTGGTLVFAPGQTNAVIEVEIIPDAVDEWSEYFFVDLRINGDFGPSTVSPEHQRVQVTLEESDYLFFEGYQTEKTVFESDGTVEIVVERAAPSQRDISVGIIVNPDSPGDSQAGVDWQDTRPWRVSFAPGATSATLNLELIDNAEKDGKRTLNLRLDDPWGGASAESWAVELALTIFDDETKPGMLAPAESGHVHIAPAGTNRLEIPLTRMGGTDGQLEVNVEAFGPSLPWGAVTAQLQPAMLEEGETEALLVLELDRTDLSETLAPFGVVYLTAPEPPYETASIPFVFYPDGELQTFDAFAAASGFSLPDMLPDGDDDLDGEANLIEVAAFGDPLSASIQSDCDVDFELGQINWHVPLRTSRQLAVFAQCTSQLTNWENSSWNAGQWEESEYGLYGDLSGNPPQPAKAAFSRLVFIWLDAN
jgi:hypothetical protein